MNNTLLQRLKHHISNRHADGLYRQRQALTDCEAFINFSSNDYLSLTSDSRLKKAYQTGYTHYPVGSGGSPLVSGYHPVHRQLENAFAEALGVDDAVFVSSGYAANLSLMALFSKLDALLLMDKAVHASIYDGLTSSGVRFKRYRHCDVEHLKQQVESSDSVVVLTESVFSMSGQQAPLQDIANIARQHEWDLCVDEAHAFGVIGEEGLGLVKASGLTQEQVPLRVIPLGKAFAGSGAIIAGQKDWLDALLQCAKPYIYSTAPSPALAYGLLQTLDVIRAADERRTVLCELIGYFRAAIASSGLTWRDSTTAIQQLQLGCPLKAQAFSEHLFKNGIMCWPMRAPTVTRQETGLRVILNYHHQPSDIDYFFRCLDEI